MNAEALGYLVGQVGLAALVGILVAWAIRRSARRMAADQARSRRRVGLIVGVVAALVVFFAPAVNRVAASPEEVAARAAAAKAEETAAQLAGFARGFDQRCEERCAEVGGAREPVCRTGCACVTDQIASRIDADALYAITRAEPTLAVMQDYALANMSAIEAAYAVCGAVLE